MDLTLTEEQQLIRSSTREFLRGECPPRLVRELVCGRRGYSRALWQQMAELGYMGLAFPEAYGGSGCSFIDLCILIEELGRFRVPGPFSSTVLCGLALARFGSDLQKSTYLDGVAGGTCIMSYAEIETGASWELSDICMTAAPCTDGYVLNGEKLFVPFAHTADILLVAARVEGMPQHAVALFMTDAQAPGVSCEPLDSIDLERQSKLTFQDVTVPVKNVLGGIDEGGKIVTTIHEWGAAAKCAEMVGGAERVLEMSVDYAKTRVQFDRLIGGFQAVQHRCADMALAVATSRFLAYEAIWRLSEDPEGPHPEISMAKAWVSDAYRQVCASGHQIHGAIGFTEEHDIHLYFRHANTAGTAFGDSDYHREKCCRYLGI